MDFVGVVGGLHTKLVHQIVEEYPELDLLLTTGHDYPLVDVVRDGQISTSKDQMYGFLGETLVLYANADVYGIHYFDIGIDENNNLVSVDGSKMEVHRQVREDPAMSMFLESYYKDVSEESSLLGGDSQPLFEWDIVHQDREYVGITICASCHHSQNEHWFQTEHASAYGTLLDVHRHQFPKCVKCHVAGLGRPSGFSILQPDRNLANVQCEVCHGPGSEHIKSPSPSTIRRKPLESSCLECHNTDHDDDFSYRRDYELIMH